MLTKRTTEKWKEAASVAPNTSDLSITSAEGLRQINGRLIRRYADLYQAQNDDQILSLLAPNADFLSLWGAYHGPIAFRVMLAEERRHGIQFKAPAGSGPGGFVQCTEEVFERHGWSNSARGGLYKVIDRFRPIQVRETLVLKDGRIKARVLQLLFTSLPFSIGSSGC